MTPRILSACILVVGLGALTVTDATADLAASRSESPISRVLPLGLQGPIRDAAEIMVWPPKPPITLVPLAEVVYQTPYGRPMKHFELLSGYRDRRGRKRHNALDLEGVGRFSGLGTPIYAVGRSRIQMLGSSWDEPRAFGRVLRRRGTVRRGGHTLPASMTVAGYGRVYFFTRNYGRWRSGTIIETELLDGPLAGHTVRYMHLGAIHPDLQEGDIVERGQEIGLLGGTAVMTDSPHLHIDASNRRGNRIDLSSYMGIDSHGEIVVADSRVPSAKPVGPPKH